MVVALFSIYFYMISMGWFALFALKSQLVISANVARGVDARNSRQVDILELAEKRHLLPCDEVMLDGNRGGQPIVMTTSLGFDGHHVFFSITPQ